MSNVAARIRAGEYTDETIREDEETFRELAAGSEFAERADVVSQSDREAQQLLKASQEAAQLVVDAIDAIRAERRTGD